MASMCGCFAASASPMWRSCTSRGAFMGHARATHVDPTPVTLSFRSTNQKDVKSQASTEGSRTGSKGIPVWQPSSSSRRQAPTWSSAAASVPMLAASADRSRRCTSSLPSAACRAASLLCTRSREHHMCLHTAGSDGRGSDWQVCDPQLAACNKQPGCRRARPPTLPGSWRAGRAASRLPQTPAGGPASRVPSMRGHPPAERLGRGEEGRGHGPASARTIGSAAGAQPFGTGCSGLTGEWRSSSIAHARAAGRAR